MKYRKLRIAWSVWWGVATALLCVLWVRSCYMMDHIYAPTSSASHVYIVSLPGQLQLTWTPARMSGRPHRLHVLTVRIADIVGDDFSANDVAYKLWREQLLAGPISRNFHLSATSFIAPYWILVIPSGCLAIAPWLRSLRFSLRTLLVAMTLVAVGLGVIVWLR